MRLVYAFFSFLQDITLAGISQYCCNLYGTCCGMCQRTLHRYHCTPTNSITTSPQYDIMNSYQQLCECSLVVYPCTSPRQIHIMCLSKCVLHLLLFRFLLSGPKVVTWVFMYIGSRCCLQMTPLNYTWFQRFYLSLSYQWIILLSYELLRSFQNGKDAENNSGQEFTKSRMLPVTDKDLASMYVLCHPSPTCS